ncbi:MAG: putative GumE protein [Rhodospirillales bacterium]|nr:putative GumE protein [Rhodospirillales bacterium]
MQSEIQGFATPFVDGRSSERAISRCAAAAIVILASSFNFFLCMLSTRGLYIGAPQVIACEIALLAGAAHLARNVFSRYFVAWTFVLFGYLTALALWNSGLDLKIARDLAITVAFCALGLGVKDRGVGDVVVYVLVTIVLVVGLFELLDIPDYSRLVNISAYYVDKGSLDYAQAQLAGGQLFVSGIRPNAESHLIDIFDGHRMSSIFLEPVSSGNFPAIAFAWLVCRFKVRPKLNAFFIVLCIVEIVLADARFGALTCGIIAALLATPLARRASVAFAIPFAVVAVLVTLAWTLGLTTVTDDLTGRLFGSGDLISSLDLTQWLALRPVNRSTVDCGYGYLITNAGVIAVVAFWFVFMGRGKADLEAALIRSSFAVYIGLSLSVNASVFTVKTAALLWFLYGLVYPLKRKLHPAN